MKTHTIGVVLASMLTFSQAKAGDQIVVGSCIGAISSQEAAGSAQILLEPNTQGKVVGGTLTSGMPYKVTDIQNGYIKIEGTDSSYSFARGTEIGWVKQDQLQIRDQSDCDNRS